MKPTEFFRWWIVDEVSGKRRRTRHLMSRETAADYPGAEPDLTTREVRNLPESEDEYNVARRERPEAKKPPDPEAEGQA